MPQPPCRAKRRRSSVLTALAGALAVTAVLAYVLADRREEFDTALQAAPLWILLVATALQFVALVSRTESWRFCVAAAGGTIGRRCLYRAASLGYVGSQLNSQIGTAARIGALRRAALGAVGVDASVFDATAVLIAMVTLSQLPVGPSVGAAAVVLILGADGAALAATAGVLLTATGTLGALAYAGWAGLDRVWMLRPAARHGSVAARPHVHPSPEPQPAIGAAR